jgi:putative N6-adenine-specific DNA methylase
MADRRDGRRDRPPGDRPRSKKAAGDEAPAGDATAVLSRGGPKLEAALDRFGVATAVRGAAAVDVGASTGGFTAALLRHGARSVVAVDVGHGQLHAALRGDPRVTMLENADWKTLALTVAPGPFDLFTVDVSFVAARSMLRGLAFRLRDGAQGMVLVKPQFELADHQVRGGKVDDPNLRRLALEKFSAKAQALGFEIVASDDSPVAGGSGTIEILTWLRFHGRPATMPQPGERREKPAKAPSGSKRGARTPDRWSWFAVSGPGLEDATHAEVARLPGVQAIARVDGGVEFAGSLEVALQANLWLRTATRLVVRLGSVRAREFGKLRRLLANLPWETFVTPTQAVKISATTSRCRLYHTGALAETVEAAIADRVRGRRENPEPPAGTEPLTILVRGVEDSFMISVDSSGERLHRRGWRVETAKAPLRETLAAGLLALCEWDGTTAFCDPMCGAGTIALEACAQARNVAPGARRAFGFQNWPLFDAAMSATWDRLRQEATAGERTQPAAPIVASDRSAEAVEIARRNAERGGFADSLTFTCAELGDVRPPAPTGLVLLNPPYGRRLGHEHAATRLYRDIGRALRAHFRGWRVGLLAANQAAANAVGLPVQASFRLSNGGIPVTLLRIQL